MERLKEHREQDGVFQREGNQETAAELIADGSKTRITDWGQ